MSKSLVQSNIHLRDADKRERAMARNIESSSAIEGIRLTRDAKTGRFVSRTKPSSPPETTESSRSPR